MRRNIQQLHDNLNQSTRAGQRGKWIVWWEFRIGRQLWLWFRLWIWHDQRLYCGNCLRPGR